MKFVHLADVHLGAEPDSGTPWSQERGAEIWETFRRAISLVKEEGAKLLLIAGDLFHRQPLLRELREVNYLFSTIPETAVVLMAGNHDYLKKDSAYGKIKWEPNVAGLWERECVCLEIPHLKTWVYGLSYYAREEKRPLYDKLRPGKDPGRHILLAHGGDAAHIPLSFERLGRAGFDYVALGHIHKPQILSGEMAYAGALEPLDRNDTGPHGLIVGEWEGERLKLQFRSLACREYVDLNLMVEPETTQFSLEEQISRKIQERGEENLYRIRLTGRRNEELCFAEERLRGLGRITEIQDETTPDYDLALLGEQYEGTLIGAYIEEFQKKGALTRVEELALYYGLQEMLREKV